MKTLESFMDECTEEDKTRFAEYRKSWMSDDQFLCWLFMSQLFNGFHHVNGTPMRFGSGIKINLTASNMATWDYDYLTKAVIMAHNWGVRFELEPASPRYLRFILHKRHLHTTIEQAIKKYNHI